MRWISNYSRKYLGAIVWYITLGVVTTILGLWASVISKDIIDIVTGYQTGYVVWVAIAFVTMQLVKIILSAVTGRISAKVQLRISQEIRADVFKKIMYSQWEPLSQFHSGDILTRSSKDTDTVSASVISWVPSLIVNLLQFIGTFLVLFFFDSTLAILALASAPVTLLMSVFFAKRIRKYSKEMRNIGSEMTSFHAEALQNVESIKSFGVVDVYYKKLLKVQEKQKDATLEYNRFSIMTSSFLSLVGMVVGGVCFFWSVYRLWTNHITFGEMTLFLQLSGSLSNSFSGLVSLAPAAITAATAAGRIMDVTQLPPEEFEHQDEIQHILNSDENAVWIQADDLNFSYNSGKTIFQNANFLAAPGEIVAFVGASGEGKTTMLRLLLGIVTAEQGGIQIKSEATDIVLYSSSSTRNIFSYVPQDNTLFSGTIAENLRIINPTATDNELEKALQIACAYDFVNMLPDGIYTQIGERGHGLSEGQIQRLSIARALLSNAPVLLLDEATSALDVDTERILLSNIIEYKKGCTCIVTTHRPSVLEVCQRVYRIGNKTVTLIDKTEVNNLINDCKDGAGI